jgi:hypothetical protein
MFIPTHCQLAILICTYKHGITGHIHLRQCSMYLLQTQWDDILTNSMSVLEEGEVLGLS